MTLVCMYVSVCAPSAGAPGGPRGQQQGWLGLRGAAAVSGLGVASRMPQASFLSGWGWEHGRFQSGYKATSCLGVKGTYCGESVF